MNRKTQQNFEKIIKLIILTLGLGLVLLPIWYMIITSFKPQTMIFELPPRLWPQTWTLKNYIVALGKDKFGLYFMNSAKVAIISTLLTVLVSSMLAFVFARLRFRGKETLFYIFLLGMMVPPVMLIIPQFIVAKWLNLFNHTGLILVYTTMNISMQTFLLRGVFENVPRDLEEAALIDGGGPWTIFWRIILPLSWPGISVVIINTFLYSWEEFAWANVAIKNSNQRTLPIAIALFQSEHLTEWGQVFAASLVALVPVLIIFIIFQRHFVQGISTTGLKVNMRIVDFYPSQGSFSPGESIKLFIEIKSPSLKNISLQVSIQHLAEQPVILEHQYQIEPGIQTLQIEWRPPEKTAGYSARLLIDQDNQAATAFDVLASWTDFPRYGFLSDFSASRSDPETAIKKLTRFHINGLQFYDWQYRHDQLLAPTEEYIDPLGRTMSLPTVRKLVDTAHKYGMVAMPYLAIYAASNDFWRAHPDWALYDEAGNPIAFGDNFLGLMDPSEGSSWSQHLLDEGTRTLQGIPFDGLHIDQYGAPKRAWNANHTNVDLPQAFVDFIQSASNQHTDKTVLFNAVGNWPVEALAESAVNFMYIEVWPPDLEYRRLAEIVLNAVRLSQGKAVVIAHYLPANRPANNLLADAVILACGGTRIELGEESRLLSDPYFPKHEEIAPDLYAELRHLADFTVRDGEWLRPYTLSTVEKEAWSESELNPKFISIDASIMTLARHHPKTLVVQMVNFSGLDFHQQWDVIHAAPTPCENIPVKIQTPKQPAQIFWDCPEQLEGPQAIDFEYSNRVLTFHIPQINYTGLVAIHE